MLLIEEKDNRKTWVITLNIVEALYSYTSFFIFPIFFWNYQNKYDLQVKVQILKAFASIRVEKRIYIKDIYGFTVLSNTDKTKVKKIIV